MFGVGVIIAGLAIPAPLTAVYLGWPTWTMFAAPIVLILVGLAVMRLGDRLDWPGLHMDPEELAATIERRREVQRLRGLVFTARHELEFAEQLRLIGAPSAMVEPHVETARRALAEVRAWCDR